jgi:hypothetical protein
VIELTCTHSAPCNNNILLLLGLCRYFFRLFLPSFAAKFFLFLCRVAAGAPCPAVTSSFFFFFQAIKVSSFSISYYFSQPSEVEKSVADILQKGQETKEEERRRRSHFLIYFSFG